MLGIAGNSSSILAVRPLCLPPCCSAFFHAAHGELAQSMSVTLDLESVLDIAITSTGGVVLPSIIYPRLWLHPSDAGAFDRSAQARQQGAWLTTRLSLMSAG